MLVLVLNTCMDTNMQFIINSFRQLFIDKIFSLTFPCLLVKFMTFPWQLSNSLPFPGFPDKWSPWYHTVCDVRQKFLSPWSFLKFFSQWLRILKQNFACLLCIEVYSNLQNFNQLFLNLTQLCHIKHNQLTQPVRRRTGWGPTVPTPSQRMNDHQIHQTSTHLTTMCGVQCFRHFTNFTQSPRPFQS